MDVMERWGLWVAPRNGSAAMSDKHNPIGKINKFVPEPDDKYRDNCGDPGWKGKQKGANASTDAFAFIGRKTFEDDKGNKTTKYYPVKHEAHHILSVSCVNGYGDLDEDQKKVVERCCHETDWNINNANNLIALPLFGHTLKWYVIDENTDPPEWKDLPQHDWDHNSAKGYCADVKKAVLDFYGKLELQVEGHTVTAKSIRDDLIGMENDWRAEIKERGEGTHDAWGNMAVQANWYEPFSMAAKGNATYRPPLRIENKIKRLKELLEHFGGAN